MLKVQELTVSYGDRAIIQDLSFQVEAGNWLMVLGPNGSGKSTLIRALSAELPYQGSIQILGQEVAQMAGKERGQAMGVLAQNHQVLFDYTVEEVVALGRYPYQSGFFAQLSSEDWDLIDSVLDETGLQDLRKASILDLSGGEVQRTFLAQVLVQDPALMILDEPSNHLDLSFEDKFYEAIDKWRRQEGRAVISIMHDLSVAKAYGDLALLLDGQGQILQGETKDLLNRETLQEVYGIDVVAMMQKRYRLWTDQ